MATKKTPSKPLSPGKPVLTGKLKDLDLKKAKKDVAGGSSPIIRTPPAS